MLNKLEQHIRDNREELDMQIPDYDRLWKGIEDQLPGEAAIVDVTAKPAGQRKVYRIAEKPKKRSLWKREPVLRWAASLIVAISVGMGWNLMNAPILPMDVSVAEADTEVEEKSSSGLPADFADMEAFYRDAITDHKSQLVAYHEEGISLDDRFSIDFDQLQQDYTSLQKELNVSEHPELVIDAMVQNLTMQLDIVQQQLRILKSIKKAQQTTNDAVQI